MDELRSACASLRKGDFIIIYDGDEREGEADLIFHAAFATPEKIRKMRTEAGGLICVALGSREADSLKLPFYTDMLRNAGFGEIACKRAPYGDEPAFSFSVNHKKTYTGITDNDRALTIREIERAVRDEKPYNYLVENFYSPGHVFLLRSRGLKNRQGHTELATAIAEKAGLTEAVVLCEMLGEGTALKKDEVARFAKKNGIAFVEGKIIMEEIL